MPHLFQTKACGEHVATAQEEVNLGRLFLLSPLVPFHNSDEKAKQNDFSLMSTVLRNHFPFGLGPYNSHLSRICDNR